MSHWRLQNILDVDKLDKNTIETLSKILDRYGNKKFARIPEQYIKYKEIRLSYDKEILEALNINVKEEVLVELYNSIMESFNQWFVFSKTIPNQEINSN